jgi:hypothetical protein
MSRRARAVVAALLCATLLVGCASDTSRDNEPETSVPTAEAYSGEVTVQPGSDPSAEGARADVTDQMCEEEQGTWTARGRVTNPLDEPRSYRIYVSFVDGGGQTRAVRQVDVFELAPAGERQWETTVPLGGATGVRCVLRVERYDPN